MAAKKSTRSKPSNDSDDVSLDILAEVVVENFEESTQIGDPFEYYVHSVRAHIQGNKDTYKSRVTKGYKTLINELSQNPFGHS